MTYDEFEQHALSVVDNCMRILATKGRTYSGSQAFSTIRTDAERLGIKPEQVLMVYVVKHVRALEQYAREGSCPEGALSRIEDTVNFLVYLHALAAGQDPAPPKPEEFDVDPKEA